LVYLSFYSPPGYHGNLNDLASLTGSLPSIPSTTGHSSMIDFDKMIDIYESLKVDGYGESRNPLLRK